MNKASLFTIFASIASMAAIFATVSAETDKVDTLGNTTVATVQSGVPSWSERHANYVKAFEERTQ